MTDTGNVVVFSNSTKPPDEEYDDLIEAGALPETRVVLPKVHISVSQVHLYQSCPRAYYWRYVKDLILPPRARIVEGQAVHKALETAHKQRMTSGQRPPLDVLLDAHADAWAQLKTDIEEWDDDNEDKILKRACAFLTQYHRKHMHKLKPIVVEKRFWMTIGQQQIPLLGYIDLITEEETVDDAPDFVNREVVDYKVVSRAKSQNDVDADLQLTVYSRATGLSRVRFDQFVKTASPRIQIIRSWRDRKSHMWAQEVFEEVAKAIAAGIFPPCDPGYWMCTENWCGFWRKCRGAK